VFLKKDTHFPEKIFFFSVIFCISYDEKDPKNYSRNFSQICVSFFVLLLGFCSQLLQFGRYTTTTQQTKTIFFIFGYDDILDFTLLYPQDERDRVDAGVLNGISISDDIDSIYVTGKNWDRMFRVQLNYPDHQSSSNDNNDNNNNNNNPQDNNGSNEGSTIDDIDTNTDDNMNDDESVDNSNNNNNPDEIKTTTTVPTSSPSSTSLADTSNNDNSNVSDNEIQNWIDATVTLQSGPNMYEVIEQLTHLSTSFTEGLTYNDGILYESIGMNGQSAVYAIDTTDMTNIIQQTTISSQYFGEGLTYRNGLLYQLTWKSRTGFIYNSSDIETTKPQQFQFATTRNEGWGLTYDKIKDEFIVSDGSQYIHFWDPTTMQEKRKIEVIRQNNQRTTYINELEYYRNRVLANIWFEDTIIVINPETGIVEKEYGTFLILKIFPLLYVTFFSPDSFISVDNVFKKTNKQTNNNNNNNYVTRSVR
jgi:glutamine cyclotransferase